MLMVIPDAGKLLWLQWALVSDGSDFEDFKVELYINDYTPDDDSLYFDFDGATFLGSGPFAVARSDFSAPIAPGHVAESQADDPPTWSIGGGSGQIVYGWFMYTEDGMVVVAAQRFDVPRHMDEGATETLDPFKIKLKGIE